MFGEFELRVWYSLAPLDVPLIFSDAFFFGFQVFVWEPDIGKLSECCMESPPKKIRYLEGPTKNNCYLKRPTKTNLIGNLYETGF